MIFLLYVGQFYIHVRSYLSTCIRLLPCRCLPFSSSWHCPHLGGISALLHHLLFWNPLFVPLMSCTSLEMVSLKSRKRRQWSQWLRLPEVPGSQTMWGKVWSKLRKDLHPCLQNRVSCLLVKKVTWKHTLACWLAFLASHKEARTFHKSLQEVKYARLLGRQGEKKTRVEQRN